MRSVLSDFRAVEWPPEGVFEDRVVRIFGPNREEVTGSWRRLRNEEHDSLYEGVSRSFRTSRLERKLQMVQLPSTWYIFIAIL
jgi:hypothetical protein